MSKTIQIDNRFFIITGTSVQEAKQDFMPGWAVLRDVDEETRQHVLAYNTPSARLDRKKQAAKDKARAEAEQFAAECDARLQAMRDTLDQMMQEVS